jgi:predicted enzyme related to lactoylglutathione lyase
MSDKKAPDVGKICWVDLTVKDAESVKTFYNEVVGWTPEPVDMGEYNDFSMVPPDSEDPMAGVCHARGVNADLPPAWMIYITVKDLDHSVERCVSLGGRIRVQPKEMGSAGRYCVIEDPAGAVSALIEPKSS